jgi:hypothetical protein
MWTDTIGDGKPVDFRPIPFDGEGIFVAGEGRV